MKHLRIGSVLAFLLLSACGGEECETCDTTPPPCMVEYCTPVSETLPYAPLLTVSYGVKELQFVWSQSVNAACYRLYEDVNGTGDYVQVGNDLTVTEYSHGIGVHLFDWNQAKFRVDACNDFGCVSSNELTFVNESVGAIGNLLGENTVLDDDFGISVAVSGDGMTMAVGAPREDGPDDGTSVDSGAAYVFTGGDGAWTQQAYLRASNALPNAKFGNSVALSGDGNTLAVGAYRENGGAVMSGAVYIFVRNGTDWTEQKYLKASDSVGGILFGSSVALSEDGNILAVGAISQGGSGAVYLFTRTGSDWDEKTFVKASNEGAGDHFGSSVSLSDDGGTLAVGAPDEDGAWADPSSSGAVYVFTRSGDAWPFQKYLQASNTAVGAYFGFSVALSGDGTRLAVGAYREDSGEEDSGAAYLFLRSGSDWVEEEYLKAPEPVRQAEFGISVALNGDGSLLAVGEIQSAVNSAGVDGEIRGYPIGESGAVYLLERTDTTWSQRAFVKAPDPTMSAHFGSAVDFSGDGSTMGVGACGTFFQKAYVY